MIERYAFRRRRNIWDYLLPFFIIVCALAVLVLAVQLFRSIREERSGGLKHKAHLYFDRGSAEVLPWGLTHFTKAYHGTLLLEGDRLRTDDASFAVVSFFDGTLARLNENTEIVLKRVHNGSKEDEITLHIVQGAAWVTTTHRTEEKPLRLLVRTPEILVEPVGSIFLVEHFLSEIVRVFSGKVRISVLEAPEGTELVPDRITVGIGQEVMFGTRELLALRERRNPDLLEAISDAFKETTFYQWNREEDIAPTAYAPAAAPIIAEAPHATEAPTPEISVAPETPPPPEKDTTPPPQPIIHSPTAPIVHEADVVIGGAVSKDAMKVIVHGRGQGYEEQYTLLRYVPGSERWSYVAAVRFRNLSPGENRYEVFAEDAAGNRSAPAIMTLRYEPEVSLGSEPLPEPKVLTFNGGESSETTVDKVEVVGEVDPRAITVVVNGYALQAFEPGSGKWVYYAAAKFGTMKPGLNRYRVYAEDSAGNRSPVTTFTILWKQTAEPLGPQE